MNIYTATEMAYQNGYEKGCKETAEMILNEYKVHCSMGGSKETFEKWFCREFGVEIKE